MKDKIGPHSQNPAEKPVMPFKAVFPGKYIQGEGLIAGLPEIIKSFGNRGMIISSPTAKDRILSGYAKQFAEAGILLGDFKGECCEKELDRLLDLVRRNKIDVLAGVGGGKTIDTAKIVADRASIPVIIVPTIASTDAPCSGCAVIYSESAGLASAHSIHNGLSALDETHSFYHGEKVAFGVLAGLHLTDAAPSEIERVYSFCEKTGLPTTFKDIGVLAVDDDKLMKVARKACAPQEAIHHEAGQISAEKVRYALIAADAMGRSRKQDARSNF